MTFVVIYAAVITFLYVIATVAYNDLAAENQRLKDAERRQQMAAPDQPRVTLYEVVSLYDSRIIRRDMSHAQAAEWVAYLNHPASGRWLS